MLKLNPKAKWVEFRAPSMNIRGMEHEKWYHWGDAKVCVSLDDGLWHMSISCPNRYPNWDEIHTAWYDLVPGAGRDFNGAILLPRHSEYVNKHPNCFHVHQLHDAEIPAGILL